MAHLLYVEDDENLGYITQESLERAGYTVTHCIDGKAALSSYQSGAFDLCIFDVMLPQMDGFTLAREVRQRNADVPIIFLTARGQKEDRIAGLRLGADDYLTKPFSLEELVLKIEVFLRRSRTTAAAVPSSTLRLGASTLDTANLVLECPAGAVTLTQKETDLLAYLAQRPGAVVKRDQLLTDLWGNNDYFLGRSLDVFISRLRKHLSGDPALQIDTVHGVGFRLVVG